MSNKQKNKLYIKATGYYEKGEIDKALETCEEAISENLKDSAILNLKGLLLYIKGDLQGALTSWRINADFNDDSMAKGYIKDVKKDKERLDLYNKSEELIKKIKIDEAIILLNKCLESDFNSIKVNIALARCYLRKGEYSTASVYITKALDIDRNNQIAKVLAKELKEFAGIELEVVRKQFWIKPMLVAILVGIICIVGIKVYNMSWNNADNSNVAEELDKHQEENIDSIKENDEEEKGETKVEALVNIDEIEKSINNKDYSSLYELLKNLNANGLKGKEKALYVKGVEILETEGVDTFYKSGMNFYEKGELTLAKDEFYKAYKYGKESYLYPHIVFFNAVVNEKSNNNLESIKYYEEYYQNYKDGNYIEETLYKLALLYKEEDIDKSIGFATELRNSNPNSIYNNDTISNLLEKNK
ncbi:tetratricopeptide repeat protein [Clostridium paraputrificum]|uniref:tetratricopeptide repeat protein n=1 Tax=Clostridium paraputrificum TaxID=29363 RepID=UPI003D35822B